MPSNTVHIAISDPTRSHFDEHLKWWENECFISAKTFTVKTQTKRLPKAAGGGAKAERQHISFRAKRVQLRVAGAGSHSERSESGDHQFPLARGSHVSRNRVLLLAFQDIGIPVSTTIGYFPLLLRDSLPLPSFLCLLFSRSLFCFSARTSSILSSNQPTPAPRAQVILS